MGFEITDGTGKGNSAAVDGTNRVLTRAITESIFEEASEDGNAYFIGAPLITVVNASTENAIIYFKNNGDEPIIMGDFFVIAEETLGGSPNMLRLNWYKNPTGISSGTTATPLNQNFGSSKSLDSDFLYGAAGSTVSGGSLVATLPMPIGEYNIVPANLVLEKGSSLAITVSAPAGNTSMPVTVGSRVIAYEERY